VNDLPEGLANLLIVGGLLLALWALISTGVAIAHRMAYGSWPWEYRRWKRRR